MHDDSDQPKQPQFLISRPKFWWLATLGCVGLAVFPIFVATVGLWINDRELQAYHWHALVTLPVCGGAAVICVIVAGILTVKRIKSGN